MWTTNSDQTVSMCRLIWVYVGGIYQKGLFSHFAAHLWFTPYLYTTFDKENCYVSLSCDNVSFIWASFFQIWTLFQLWTIWHATCIIHFINTTFVRKLWLFVNMWRCLPLFVPYLSFFWCLGKAVLRDCGISWISSLIFVTRLRSNKIFTLQLRFFISFYSFHRAMNENNWRVLCMMHVAYSCTVVSFVFHSWLTETINSYK